MDQEGNYLVNIGLVNNLLELEEARNAVYRNDICISLECSTFASPSIKQLATLLDEAGLNTLVKVLHKLGDGLPIQQDDGRHCRL